MASKNLDIDVTNLDGTAVKDGTPGKENTALKIKTAIVEALKNPLRGDENLSAAQIFKNMALADRIFNSGDEVDIESEEISTIKERVSKGWPPTVAYRVTQCLEK